MHYEVPYVFGRSDPAGVDFVRANTTERSRITQHVVNASLSGDRRSFFILPGGPVGFVVGGEYRKESSSFVPDPLEQHGLRERQLPDRSVRLQLKRFVVGPDPALFGRPHQRPPELRRS